MVCDLLVHGLDRGEAPGLHEVVEQLGVVDDLVVAAELRVLAVEGVQAVRAGHDDLGGLDLVEHLDVLHALHLEQELVARAACRVTGAGLAIAEHHEVHAGDVEQLGHGLGGALRAILEGTGAADPEQVVDILGDGLFAVRAEHPHLEVDLGHPVVAVAGVHAPGVALGLDVLEQAVELGRELGRDHDLIAAHVGDVVDVLDVDRALVHAGAAHGAAPENIFIDDRQVDARGAVAVEGVAVVGRML